MKLRCSISLIRGPGDEVKLSDATVNIGYAEKVAPQVADHASEYALEIIKVHLQHGKPKRVKSSLP